MRTVVYVIGAIFVGVTCLPLLPWYLLGMFLILRKRHEQKVFHQNTIKVFKMFPPEVLERIVNNKK